MPPHASSSVQKAREDLAGRLREIRKDAGQRAGAGRQVRLVGVEIVPDRVRQDATI